MSLGLEEDMPLGLEKDVPLFGGKRAGGVGERRAAGVRRKHFYPTVWSSGSPSYLATTTSLALKRHFGVTKTWRGVAERFYWKGMVADTFYFYDLLKFSEKIDISGTDLTVYNRDPSGEQILWWGTDFMVGNIFWGSKFCGLHSTPFEGTSSMQKCSS